MLFARAEAYTAVQLIVLSFTLIISLMIGTFTVVYKAGGIHFNE